MHCPNETKTLLHKAKRIQCPSIFRFRSQRLTLSPPAFGSGANKCIALAATVLLLVPLAMLQQYLNQPWIDNIMVVLQVRLSPRPRPTDRKIKKYISNEDDVRFLVIGDALVSWGDGQTTSAATTH